MGTYSDSKIQRASKDFKCSSCGGAILKGDDYLRYVLGLKWRVPVHISCAVRSKEYSCAAIEAIRAV